MTTLRLLAFPDPPAEPHSSRRSGFSLGDHQLERIAGVPQPHLIGVDPVPQRPLAGLDDIINRGRRRALARLGGRAICLAVPAALRMRREVQSADQFFGGHARSFPGALDASQSAELSALKSQPDPAAMKALYSY